MLPVRKSGGPGKEVPPERASTNHKKKGTVRYWELPKKNTETCFDKMERICPASIEGHANAAVNSGRMKQRKFYRNPTIDRQKAQLTRPLSWVVMMPAKATMAEGAARRGENERNNGSKLASADGRSQLM
jgi:hypothetical protein